MEVKTDTKEKFHVIGVAAPHLSANLTEQLCNMLQQYLSAPVRNVVLMLPQTVSMDEEAAECLVKTQQQFYEGGASFVICEITESLETFLDSKDLLELMNITPTESEAWDIVQMEEIERELFNDDEEDHLS